VVAKAKDKARRKMKLMVAILRLLRMRREARSLETGLRACEVMNTLEYDKSMKCCVGNARALQQQLASEEQSILHVVWELEEAYDASSWDRYLVTFFAAIRRLVFKL
jgi:hypothetical protein